MATDGVENAGKVNPMFVLDESRSAVNKSDIVESLSTLMESKPWFRPADGISKVLVW